MSAFVEDLCQLALKVFRENRMGDRPTDDRELFCPGTGRSSPAILLVKHPETLSNERAVARIPTRSKLLKRRPVLSPGIQVSELTSISDPGEKVLR
jgi:hypothetical protein